MWLNGYLVRVVAVVVWSRGLVVVLSMKSLIHSNDSIHVGCLLLLLLLLLVQLLLLLLLLLVVQFLLLQISALHVGSDTVVVVEDGYGEHFLCSFLANNILVEMLYNLICMQSQYAYTHRHTDKHLRSVDQRFGQDLDEQTDLRALLRTMTTHVKRRVESTCLGSRLFP